MTNLDIPCMITYELKEGKVMAYLKPEIPKGFDFESLQKILEVYSPLRSSQREEKEALKKVTDSLLNIIATRVIKTN